MTGRSGADAPDPRPAVLVLAGGAGWETAVLPALERARVVVLRRCVDDADLMAGASTGMARVAIVAAEHRGLDAEVVRHLARHGVRCVAVSSAPSTDADRFGGLGVAETVPPAPEAVVAAVLRVAASTTGSGLPEVDLLEPEPSRPARQRVVAVWGPAGAPGRTTVAITIAAEVAAAGSRVLLVDADPYGGTVAQRLGVLDEASGLLGVARAANNGLLDPPALLAACRRVAGVELLTGLPRAERRTEVRPGVLDEVIEVAATIAPVVVDCGFGLEDDPSSRDGMTLEALHAADEVVAVGASDPVGLTRLLRGLADLAEAGVEAPVRVVLNRLRPGLGWRTEDLIALVAGGHLPAERVHVVPDDGALLDRALVAGSAPTELGDSTFCRAVAEVAAAVLPGSLPPPVLGRVPRRTLRRRTAGRARTPCRTP